MNATVADHQLLQAANLKLWESQNKVEPLFKELQDIYNFAEPLLKAALKSQYGVDDDVKSTYLHLYLPSKLPWYAIEIAKGVTTRSVSLLDAALHNFARSETAEADSQYTTAPDERGLFDIKPIKQKMSIEQFQTLCRGLDIGARYTEHLRRTLLPSDTSARVALKSDVVQNHTAAFIAATHLAVVTGDIAPSTRELILRMLDGQRNLTFKGQVVTFGELSIMGTALTGIVLIAPDLERALDAAPMIAYVPQDPEHPLKEYAAVSDFLKEITRQLRDNAVIASSRNTYRQYFSQFVAHSQRGHFFAALEQRLFEVQWHKKQPLDPRPTWRAEPAEHPHLQFDVEPIAGDLWTHLYQQKLNKVLNDAAHIAVSTADTDRTARWAWWDNFKKIVADIFNAALMVLTPFVPGLGELMLAYTAYQLASDVIEGFVDLAEGLKLEAAEYVVSVVTDVIQLATFSAGAAIGSEFRFKLSLFVNGMNTVRLPDGQPRLWHPDLKPYQVQNLRLSADSTPDTRGLHQYNGKSMLPAGQALYEIKTEPSAQRLRLQHPLRSNAYQPEVTHNGAGVYVIEGEQPRTWDDATLMRRLGPPVVGLSDTECATARKISGTDPAELRRMYVDNLPAPPLLTDTLQRLRIDQDIQTFINQMNSTDPVVYAKADTMTQLHLMTRYGIWPPGVVMRVIDSQATLIWEHPASTPQQGKKLIVQISDQEVRNGKLLGTIVDSLDANRTPVLLEPATENETLEQRTHRLRKKIAAVAQHQRAELLKDDYASRQASGEPLIEQLKARYPDVPMQGLQNLLATASQAERTIMLTEKRTPLRLEVIAREMQFETRTTRACEGFYRTPLITEDTERLTLNALRVYSDALRDVRIVIREHTLDGKLIGSAGPVEASNVRILVRNTAGTYEVRDTQNKTLHAADDLYQSMLHALPNDAQIRLGYRAGEGLRFKQWVMAKTEPPVERRTLLDGRPVRPLPPLQTVTLLRGPRLSKTGQTVQERVRDLYPHFSEAEIGRFVRSINDQNDPLLALRELENDRAELHRIIRDWKNQPVESDPNGFGPSSPMFQFIYEGGELIADRLIECFDRKSTVFGERSTHLDAGYSLDLSMELNRKNLEIWWRRKPELKRFLDKITTLNLDRATFDTGATGLLQDFPHLRELSARNCELKVLPQGIAKMHFLTTLRLTDNSLSFDAAAVEQLRNLTRLQVLRLDNNPLGITPDIGRMPNLRILGLSNTAINTWPAGMFYKQGAFAIHRPRGFYLDLRQNPLTLIPDVVPGSNHALLVARTRLFVSRLSAPDRLKYQQYRTSVGLGTERIYPPVEPDESAKWPIPDDSTYWAKSPGLGTYRPEAWAELAAEPQSEGFFSVIRQLTQSADYRADTEARQRLSNRVWRMIDAANLDSTLREELFVMATEPEGCADAGAQLFNNMGVKVLASEAYSFSTNASQLQTRLVALAKSASRLARVGDIARADIKTRGGQPDEVEVHLAYETNLATRLDLPWQSEHMLHWQVAGVSDITINQAYDTVLALEEGDGLVNQIIEQPFWSSYLRDTHPGEFTRNETAFEGKPEVLDNLQTAQALWAKSAALPQARSTELRSTLLNLSRELAIPDSVVLTDEVMSAPVYERLLNDIGYDRDELARRLTRAALRQAGL